MKEFAAMMPRLLKNPVDHAAALAELDRLIALDPAVGSPDADTLELLADLIDRYEREAYPIDAPDPVEMIRFVMAQKGLKQKDLVPYIGSAPRVSEVLSGRRPLTLTMIRRLHGGLHIPLSVLIGGDSDASVDPPDRNYAQYPLREMAERGWLGTHERRTPRLKENAQALVRPMLETLWSECPEPQAMAARRSLRSTQAMDPYALEAWQARVVVKALEAKCHPQHDPLTQGFLSQVAALTELRDGPRLAFELLALHGIRPVVVPHLSGTHLDGAALMLRDQRPVVALTLRHDRLDNFWFTLIHELAHLVLHVQHECVVFLDDMDQQDGLCAQETEADRLATDALIPTQCWDEARAASLYRKGDHPGVLAWARELHVHPAVVAGRIRHRCGWRRLHRLLGRGEPVKLLGTGSAEHPAV